MPTTHSPQYISDSGHGPSKGYRSMLSHLNDYLREREPGFSAGVRKSPGARRRRRLNESKLTPAQRALIKRAKRWDIAEPKLMDMIQGLGLVSRTAMWVCDLSDEECMRVIGTVKWKRRVISI